MKLSTLKGVFEDESGATAIEYGLIAALVSVAGIVALNALGASIQGIFTAISTALTAAAT